MVVLCAPNFPQHPNSDPRRHAVPKLGEGPIHRQELGAVAADDDRHTPHASEKREAATPGSVSCFQVVSEGNAKGNQRETTHMRIPPLKQTYVLRLGVWEFT